MAVDRPLISQNATVISGTRSAPFVVSQERAKRALDVCTFAPYETGADESGRLVGLQGISASASRTARIRLRVFDRDQIGHQSPLHFPGLDRRNTITGADPQPADVCRATRTSGNIPLAYQGVDV
jgi:hypothetical protein